jgi:hypothetical protein
MTDFLKPGEGLIFMKVGTHAQETLADIIERKQREIRDAGHALWGYGGNTCHPLKVQPFARDFEERDGVIYLVMEPMTSRHFAPPQRARQQSVDGVTWTDIPIEINVLGSRYAMAIDDLHEEAFELPLSSTRVAVGTQLGRPGDQYIAGHVDKACLEYVEEPAPGGGGKIAQIGLVARVVKPYAVLLR